MTRNSVAISPRHERKLENPVWPTRDQLFGTAGRPRPEPKSWAGSHQPLSGQLLPGSDDQDISQKPVSLCPPAVTQPVREAFSLTLTSFDGVSCQYWQLFRIESALTRTNIATSRLVSTDISTITSSEMHSFAPLQLGYSAVPCYEQNPSLAAGSGIR